MTSDDLLKLDSDALDGFTDRLNHYIGPGSHFTVDDEVDHVTGFLGGPAPTSDAAAGSVVVQELVDAGYLDGKAFGAGADGLIKPGPPVTAWVSAHAADPLNPGGSVTDGQEQKRVAGIVLPAITPHSGGAASTSG